MSRSVPTAAARARPVAALPFATSAVLARPALAASREPVMTHADPFWRTEVAARE